MPENEVSRNVHNLPEVTIFGAGVAGLTVAHELVERGFTVHIVEPVESPTEEYESQVGGMAANQLGRVPALDPNQAREILKQFSSQEAPDQEAREIGAILKIILPALTRLEMQPVQRRLPITQRIRFAKEVPPTVLKLDGGEMSIGVDLNQATNWQDIADEYEITNKKKLAKICNALEESYRQYRNDLVKMIKKVLREQHIDIDENKIQQISDVLQPYVLFVETRGYTDTDGIPENNRAISQKWANLVKDALLELSKGIIPHLHLAAVGAGSQNPLGNQDHTQDRARSNRVEVRIVGQRVQGEHGYRFFPNFYRHLFDTMKRTPVFDEEGKLTPETTYNQLVSTPDSAIGFAPNRGLFPVKLRRFTTIKDLKQTIKFFKETAHFTDRDLLRLQTYFLKYMTSCKERRAKEAEDVSFWEYIHADQVPYSDSAAKFIDNAPRALVAMSTRETDARTQYNGVIQLLVQNPLEPFTPDMTLNATTSEAWLIRWKAYLKRKGVKFYTGRLEGLKLARDRDGRDVLVPMVRGTEFLPKRPVAEIDVRVAEAETKTQFNFDSSDFFVMALPFEKASQKIWQTYLDPSLKNHVTRVTGPFRQLIEFDKVSGRRSEDGKAIPRKRDPKTGEVNREDPLRDISGIQYFMPNNYRFVEGHVYYPDSPWALTSISQFAYFRDRVTLTGKYIGQQSFDIGNWYNFYPESNGTTAWNSTRQELAEKTWAQALATLESDYEESLLLPKYYHLDDGIKFVKGPEALNGFMKTTAAFRANAIVKLLGIYSGKIYKIGLHHSANEIELIEVQADSSDTERSVCLKLVEKINKGQVAIANFVEPCLIILSPVYVDSVAKIKKTEGSTKEYIVFVNGEKFSVETLPRSHDNFTVTEKREGRESIITIRSKKAPNRRDAATLSVAACNADNCIELLGAPRLTVELWAPLADGAALAEIPREALDHTLVLDNENPYIINVPGQWRHRPGINHATAKIDYAIDKESLEDSLFRRWVPAGTYMATYTRLTTMEAANESGRHAVNAILQTLKALPVEKGKEPLFNGQGKLFGDLCKIWDPEDYELADLQAFKDLDEALIREGLPHILDIFRVSELLEALPEDVSLAEAVSQMRRLIESPAATASMTGLKLLETGIRAYFEAVSALLSGRMFR